MSRHIMKLIIYSAATLMTFGQLEAATEKTFGTILDPVHQTVLSSDVQGKVKKVRKKMGDSFEKGSILIELDDTIFRANFLRSMAALEKARTKREAKQELFDDDIVSLFELKEAEAEYSAAEAEMVIQKKRLDSTKIIAPYHGKVEKVMVDDFEYVNPGRELMEVVDDNMLIAKFLLPSSMVNEIFLDQPVEITIRETGETVMGKVSRIGAVIDPSSSTIRVEAQIDNKDKRYKAGMTGKATFGSSKEGSNG